MKIICSTEVQGDLASIMNIVKSGNPVTITEDGTPAMMILPYSQAVEVLREYNIRRLMELMNSTTGMQANNPEISLEEINQLVHELRP